MEKVRCDGCYWFEGAVEEHDDNLCLRNLPAERTEPTQRCQHHTALRLVAQAQSVDRDRLLAGVYLPERKEGP
jgi:hypothetical protein